MKRFFTRLHFAPQPVYPVLFGIYPVVYLWSANRTQQPAYVLLPALLATLAGVMAVYLLASVMLRSVQRAALVTTMLSFYILSYGHYAGLAEEILYILPKHFENYLTYLLPVSAGLVLALLVGLVIFRAGGPGLTRMLNVVAIALILFPLISALPYYAGVARRVQAASEYPPEMVPVTDGGPPRDVYFILVDNYGREDVLRDGSDFDNSQMVAALEERGFVFPQCTQANYYHTAPAMASILNLDYLDELGFQHSDYETRIGYARMTPLVLNNSVIRKFRTYGYHVVTFRGFMGMIDIRNSDTYVSIDEDTDLSYRLETENFRSLYYRTTIFQAINEQYQVYPDLLREKGPEFLKPLLPDPEVPTIETRFQKVFDQNLYAFDALESIPKEIEGPKFVYAHLYSAHWPFMHHPDGSMRLPFSDKMTTEGYVEGIQFTNNRLLAAIDSILENSDTEPVIILQGDHADGWVGRVEWSGKERVKILSAYYLPGGGEALLREDITPVNNFRLVFKHYFGEAIELLPDISYYLDPQTRKTMIAPKTCIGEVPALQVPPPEEGSTE